MPEEIAAVLVLESVDKQTEGNHHTSSQCSDMVKVSRKEQLSLEYVGKGVGELGS